MAYAKLSRYFGHARKSAVSNLLPFRRTSNYRVLKTASWASLAVGVAAVGLYVGRELRIRYKFNRRNPADFFAHAGDKLPADYGMGI
jgi:hypothetical protein